MAAHITTDNKRTVQSKLINISTYCAHDFLWLNEEQYARWNTKSTNSIYANSTRRQQERWIVIFSLTIRTFYSADFHDYWCQIVFATKKKKKKSRSNGIDRTVHSCNGNKNRRNHWTQMSSYTYKQVISTVEIY